MAPAVNTSLFVDIPFENLVFTVAAAQKLELTETKAATLTVNQVGTSRVVAGKLKSTCTKVSRCTAAARRWIP